MVFQVFFYFYASYSKVEISVNSTFVLVSLVSASYPISKSVHRSKADLATTVISDVILILQTLLLQSKTLVRSSQVCSTGTLWEETLAYKRVHLGQSGLTTAPMELIGREVR